MKKKNTKTVLPALIFIIGMSAMLPFYSASADQYFAGANGNIQVDVNLDNGLTYAPNDPFPVTGTITPLTATVDTVDMRVIAGGIFGQILPVQPLNTFPIYQTLNIPGATANTGAFSSIFKTGVEESSSCITPGTVEFQRTSVHRAQINYTGPATHPQYTVNADVYWNNTIIATPTFTIPANSMDSYIGTQNCNANGGCAISGTGPTGIDYGVINPANNNFCGPQIIGNVFSFGPHVHGGTTARGVAYVGAWHPQITVRVKFYGQAVDPYIQTTNPAPPYANDAVLTIPAGSGTAANPQIVYCTVIPNTNCGVPVNGANYSAVSEVSASNIGVIIPEPYHVCRYPNAPGIGMYFASAFAGSGMMDTCQNRFPDAEVIR